MTKLLLFTLLFLFSCAPQNFDTYEKATAVAEYQWKYQVTLEENKEILQIKAYFPPHSASKLVIFSDAESFVRDIVLRQGQKHHFLSLTGEAWFLPDDFDTTNGYSIQYRYLLKEAALAFSSFEFNLHSKGTIFTTPSYWLIYPIFSDKNIPVYFNIKTPSNVSFVSGIPPIPAGKEKLYKFSSTDIHQLPYSAFGSFEIKKLSLPNGILEVAYGPLAKALPLPALFKCLATAGKSVSSYFKGFPVARALVLIRSTPGDGIVFGTAKGNSGAAIMCLVGYLSQINSFEEDWMMTHEMVHLGFPSVSLRSQRWMEEGMATYVESVARTRSGLITPEEMWEHFHAKMFYGLPESGDQGLDFTPTWGRIYWGGALFCLLADIEIRKQSKNRFGLEHAFRKIVKAGGTIHHTWKITHSLAVGDQAVKGSVLSDLYHKMKDKPVMIDLEHLFQELGVEWKAQQIVLNDQAPLAYIRKAISGER